MADLNFYIDAGIVGGLGDGSTWENAFSGQYAFDLYIRNNSLYDLVTDQNNYYVWCKSSDGTKDSVRGTSNSAVLQSEDYRVRYIGADGFRPISNEFNPYAYTIEIDDENWVWAVNAPYTMIDGIQFSNTQTTSNNANGLKISASNVIVTNCISKVAGYGNCFYVGTSAEDVKFETSIAYNTLAAQNFTRGFLLDSTVNADIINCLTYNFNSGVEIDEGINNVINHADIGSTTPIREDGGTNTIDYCATATGHGTNAQTVSDWSLSYASYATFDFTPTEDSQIVNGVGPDANALVPIEDIDGESISGLTAYIGPVQYAAPTVETITPDDLVMSAVEISSPVATASNPPIEPNNLVLGAYIISSPVVTTAGSTDIDVSDLVLSPFIVESPSVYDPSDKLVLFTGAVSFPIEGLADITPIGGEIVQFSHGAYVRFSHNFPVETGDSPSLAYKEASGDNAVISGDFVDGDNSIAEFLIPDDLDFRRGTMLMSVVMGGDRGSVAFSLHSKPVDVVVFCGLSDS